VVQLTNGNHALQTLLERTEHVAVLRASSHSSDDTNRAGGVSSETAHWSLSTSRQALTDGCTDAVRP